MPRIALTLPVLLFGAAVLQSCATCSPANASAQDADPPLRNTSATPVAAEPIVPVLLENAAVRAEYAPSIDRLTSFRALGGPEFLFTQRLDSGALPDEAYTFYGGAYFWTSPQNGSAGWIGPKGQPRAWPPDPAMNIGPAQTSLQGDALTSRSPKNRLGLVEDKTFALTERGLDITYRLVNEGEGVRAGGTWINTAVHEDAKIAVRLVGPDALASLRGWDQQSIDRFVSVAQRQENGWAVIDLSTATWEGGIKVYVPRVKGELPTIAIWREGQWLVRAQRVTEAATKSVGRLATMGEGAVAVYIQPSTGDDPMVVEAELYGPIVDIAPGADHVASESWTVIDSPSGADTSLLPVYQDPAASPVQPAG